MAKPERESQAPARCWYCDAEGVSSEHIIARSYTQLFGSPDVDRDEHKIRHDYVHPEGQPGRSCVRRPSRTGAASSARPATADG